jgi:hypothetical protein
MEDVLLNIINRIIDSYSYIRLADVLKEEKLLDFNWKKEIDEITLLKKWRFVGDNPSNASSIQILNEPEKGIIERLTNAIDAVLENEKIKYGLEPKVSEDVVKVSFPRFHEVKKNILNGEHKRANSVDAADLIQLVANDGDDSSSPTLDVLDFGIGVKGEDFYKTILSIQGTNKIKVKDNYLIGSFGQGGSTSLKFSAATLIISKVESVYYITVVHKFNLKDYKKPVYAYLKGPIRFDGVFDKTSVYDQFPKHIKDFIEAKSGTLIRMYNYDLDRPLRADLAKPLGLLSYINTQLYNVPLPIKLVDERKDILSNLHSQNRYVYGSLMKIMTSSNNFEDYSGKFEVEHNGEVFNVDYFVILPVDKEDWPKDKVCEEKIREFNHYGKSIFYTVNGQYITHENYTKVRNRGLMYLENRLLIEINFDQLHNKYDYFTSDRNQIIWNKDAKGLIDTIIDRVVGIPKLIELNNEISIMTTQSKIDDEILKDISDQVKNDYLDLLTKNNAINKRIIVPRPKPEPNPLDLSDEIEFLKISNSKDNYELSERKSVFLQTGAKKYINNLYKNNIDVFVRDSKGLVSSQHILPKVMNGTMIYDLEVFLPGKYSVYFQSFSLNLKSNEHYFEVSEDLEEKDKVKLKDKLNLELSIIDDIDKEFICRNSRSKINGIETIEIVINFGHSSLLPLIEGLKEDQVEKFKQENIKPISLFVLIMKDDYNDISETEKQNKVIYSLIKSIN